MEEGDDDDENEFVG
jgi:hypothetical protein